MNKLSQLAEQLTDSKHAALITSDISRKYFCGFSSSAGVIVVTKEKNYLLIDFRYIDKAKESVTDCEVLLSDNFRTQMLDILVSHGISVLSVEAGAMTLAEFEKYKSDFAFVSFETSFLSKAISDMRVIKTPDEIEKLKKAQNIAEKAFNRLLKDIKAGQTEKHVAALLEYYMAEFGSDGKSFDTIVASGVNSASPHASPTDKKLENGDFVTIDFGATYDGYHSDTTRTLAVGEVTEEMKNMYSAVHSANLDALKAVKSNVSGKLIDSVARTTLDAWGYGSYFGHGLGHGVGLEVHEPPRASLASSDMLKDGMLLTIEPGAYISGKFGVRIEDMVVVTDYGCENLTNLSKSLIII